MEASQKLLHHLDSFLLQKLSHRSAHLLLVRRQNARNVECFVAIEEQLSCGSARYTNRLRHGRVAMWITIELESRCRGFL